jgi:ubiquinone/menaquinone biosynthesis C-methylase UbiE
VHVRDPLGAELAAVEEAVDFGGKRVIEVGCGAGRLTVFAAERARSVYAFDPRADGVAEARRALAAAARRRVSFGVHSAQAMDVRRRRFDLALCGWSL